MTQLMEEKTSHLSNFERFEAEAAAAAGNGAASQPPPPAWLDDRRRAAIARFDAVGFPTARVEGWRHTNVAPIARTKFTLATPDVAADGAAAGPVARHTFGGDAVAELVFVDGHFSLALSRVAKLPRGVRLGSLADAIASDAARVEPHLARHADVGANPFVALNTGFLRDGAYLHLARGATVDAPIHLIFVSTGGAEPTVSHPRMLVVAEDNSEVTLVKTFVGADAGAASAHFTNAVTEVYAGRNCRIDHNKVQHDTEHGYHVSTTQVRLGRDSQFVSHVATLGGKLTRNDLNVTLAEPGADATLNGLVILGGSQHCDNHTLLDHAAPNCPSHELYKHVLDGKATGVFKGKILVRQPAQKTDSKQSSKTLLLSDDATMSSQPALEIYADDVKCTHGSTTGPVDEEQVFYLRSRGVGLAAARHLMTYAFAADVTRRIKVEPVRRRLEAFLAAQHGLPQDLRISDIAAHDDAAVNM